LAAWGREHGIQVQVEAYGAPPIGLAGFQNIDIPCGEGFNWKVFTASRWVERGADVITTICTNGYSFEGIDASIFRVGLRTEGGRLALGDGNYSILVMPNLTGVDVDVLEAVVNFARGGGTLVVTRRVPDTTYGWKDRAARIERVRELTAELFGPGRLRNEMRTHVLGAGKAIFCPDEEASLLKALRSALPPDIDFADPSRYVGFQHRRTQDRDFYFIANTSDRPYHTRARFRSMRNGVEFRNPRTGAVTRPTIQQDTIDYSAVNAQYGDRFPGGDEWEQIREPFPSGLLGPVRLIFYREEP
jgi:hypothetical protein